MIKLFKYQKKGVAKLHRLKGRMLIADEMGLGKTIQALQFCHEMPAKRPVLVICPAIVKWNWEREARLHYGMTAHVLETRTPLKVQPAIKADLYIINYDILGPWMKWIHKLGIKVIVIDECQALQNRQTIRTKLAIKLCRPVKYIIPLSGTPIESRPAEIWPVLHILDPVSFPDFKSFAFRYCAPRRRWWGWEFKGATNKAELYDILKTGYMIRRRKSDVAQQLPAHTRQVIPFALSRAGQREYEHAFKDFIAWAKAQGMQKGKIKKLQRAEAITKIGYLKRLAARLKLPLVIEWIRHLLDSTDEKFIIFGIHRALLKDLAAEFTGQCVSINGSVTGIKRQKTIDEFNCQKRIRLLFGNLDAAGKGWNGVVASITVHIELAWIPSKHTQGDARVWRIGQKRKTRAFYLIAKDTIEEKLCLINQSKQEVVSSILDGGTQSDDLDIYSLLMKELVK
jgi:SWI/SNF-related matrix-associated actin-dependent regulator 1 of chromatin subfamily A